MSPEIVTLLCLGTSIHNGKKDIRFAIIMVNLDMNELDVIN